MNLLRELLSMVAELAVCGSAGLATGALARPVSVVSAPRACWCRRWMAWVGIGILTAWACWLVDPRSDGKTAFILYDAVVTTLVGAVAYLLIRHLHRRSGHDDDRRGGKRIRCVRKVAVRGVA